ncbi:MAG: putative beta-lysine N-acetyltransferase [Candidatus Gastranaerophilales bacterium]|nr:putative beta-lysine N-acetyltransferase [Candidatus Gastranaerophilales bacterium]
MSDTIELIGNSLIQHGKENNRIYLIKLAKEDYPGIIEYMDNLALNDGYTKIIAKVPAELKDSFLKDGYEYEAFVKDFFKEEDAYFLGKYFSQDRKDFNDKNDIFIITQFCIEKGKICIPPELNEKFCIKQLNKEHISQIIELFGNVFETYPFPVFDGNYILKTMSKNVDYYGVFADKKLVALASSEMDLENLNTEMTDFATLPEYRGNNLSYYLLKEMEKAAIEKGIKTAYTIARAKNTGINMTFAKMFYEFGGTLVNNTNICGNIESMNVWYKNLRI